MQSIIDVASSESVFINRIPLEKHKVRWNSISQITAEVEAAEVVAAKAAASIIEIIYIKVV